MGEQDMGSALIDGFLYKAAITNDYIMKRLVGVKKQLGNMGVVTRKHFDPGVTFNVPTGGGGYATLVDRPGSRRVFSKELSGIKHKWERTLATQHAGLAGKPYKGVAPDKQRLQNLLGMQHEKAEVQARRRFGDGLGFSGHMHPSVIEREGRLAKRFGEDSYPKGHAYARKVEGDEAKAMSRSINKDVAETVNDIPDIRTYPDWQWMVKEREMSRRWSKAYDYYRK